MHSFSYIQSAKKILLLYNGQIPFAAWLKNYFKKNKKFGSRDRKLVSHFCYCYYRLGNAFQNLEIDEKILAGLFCCSNQTDETILQLKPEWNKIVSLHLKEKLKFLDVDLTTVFPWGKVLSEEIDFEKFSESFFTQPDLFIRSRPGKKDKIIKALTDAAVASTVVGEDCIQLNNGIKIEQLLEIDRDAVVQDFNSQKVLNQLPQHLFGTKMSVWDCCAASGGKSILLYDKNPKVQLTVSDVRESILVNLKKRFVTAGIKNYKSFIADLSKKDFKQLPSTKVEGFDFIICDAPCSGSGTWSRTPEQLVFFQTERINEYASLQKKIVLNAAKVLKKGGYFMYITCSVFKKENEEVVSFIQTNTELKVQVMEYFKGYDKKADTLFAALFQL